jgi:hypothetical protein
MVGKTLKYLTTQDVKQALKSDFRFRELFQEYQGEINEFIHNPSCPCHAPLLDKIMKEKGRLEKYFPGKIIVAYNNVQPKVEELWNVINCSVSELDEKLRRLPPGRKQLTMARYEDQITVVVNMLISMPV